MITGLSPITTYTLRVRGMNSAGDGAWSDELLWRRRDGLSPEERYDVKILDDASDSDSSTWWTRMTLRPSIRPRTPSALMT